MSNQNINIINNASLTNCLEELRNKYSYICYFMFKNELHTVSSINLALLQNGFWLNSDLKLIDNMTSIEFDKARYWIPPNAVKHISKSTTYVRKEVTKP